MFEGFTKLRHLDVKKMVIYINIVGYIDANWLEVQWLVVLLGIVSMLVVIVLFKKAN